MCMFLIYSHYMRYFWKNIILGFPNLEPEELMQLVAIHRCWEFIPNADDCFSKVCSQNIPGTNIWPNYSIRFHLRTKVFVESFGDFPNLFTIHHHFGGPISTIISTLKKGSVSRSVSSPSPAFRNVAPVTPRMGSQGRSYLWVKPTAMWWQRALGEATPWRIKGWNLQPSPMKRKENHRNPTSRELWNPAVNLQGCISFVLGTKINGLIGPDGILWGVKPSNGGWNPNKPMGFPNTNDHDLGCEMGVSPFKETPIWYQWFPICSLLLSLETWE